MLIDLVGWTNFNQKNMMKMKGDENKQHQIAAPNLVNQQIEQPK